jgi:hypothetical protein
MGERGRTSSKRRPSLLECGGAEPPRRNQLARDRTDQQALTNKDKERLDRQLDLLERKLPASIGRFIRRLREPMLPWVRIPLGIVLIVGSVFSFPPMLGW